MCAIDVETTGLNPEYSTIYQLALLPLDANLEPRRDVPSFDIWIKPEMHHIDRIIWGDLPRGSKEKIAKAVTEGFETFAAIEILERWISKLGLFEGKRITPLGYNYMFDMMHIIKWMGWEAYSNYFDSRFRDAYLFASNLNDRADFHAEAIPFPQLALRQLCSRLDINPSVDQYHDAVFDCIMTARAYKKMLKEILV